MLLLLLDLLDLLVVLLLPVVVVVVELSLFENYQLTFISGRISVRVAIIYRLHPTKKKWPESSRICGIC